MEVPWRTAHFDGEDSLGCDKNTDSIDGLYLGRPIRLDMFTQMGDPQVAFRFFTMVFAHHPSYLTRVCPPTDDTLAQLEGYDARMASTLGSLSRPRGTRIVDI